MQNLMDKFLNNSIPNGRLFARWYTWQLLFQTIMSLDYNWRILTHSFPMHLLYTLKTSENFDVFKG